jgi:hypothetical protein
VRNPQIKIPSSKEAFNLPSSKIFSAGAAQDVWNLVFGTLEFGSILPDTEWAVYGSMFQPPLALLRHLE